MTSKPAKILAVDDDPEMAEVARVILERAGHEVTVETDGARALEMILEGRPDLVVTDLRMPGLDGLALIEQIRARELNIPVLVLTAYASVDSAVEVMKRGAADYLAKPFTPEELALRVERALAWTELTEENRYLRKRIESDSRHGEIVGKSEALALVLRLVDKVAATDARVLLVGETQTQQASQYYHPTHICRYCLLHGAILWQPASANKARFHFSPVGRPESNLAPTRTVKFSGGTHTESCITPASIVGDGPAPPGWRGHMRSG